MILSCELMCVADTDLIIFSFILTDRTFWREARRAGDLPGTIFWRSPNLHNFLWISPGTTFVKKRHVFIAVERVGVLPPEENSKQCQL